MPEWIAQMRRKPPFYFGPYKPWFEDPIFRSPRRAPNKPRKSALGEHHGVGIYPCDPPLALDPKDPLPLFFIEVSPCYRQRFRCEHMRCPRAFLPECLRVAVVHGKSEAMVDTPLIGPSVAFLLISHLMFLFTNHLSQTSSISNVLKGLTIFLRLHLYVSFSHSLHLTTGSAFRKHMVHRRLGKLFALASSGLFSSGSLCG
jgi:hypothetical protein